MDVKPRRWARELSASRTTASAFASTEDYAECRRVMLAASRNYSFASHFFPPDRRRYVEALYALVRIGDDFVDVSHEGYSSALQAIEAWQSTYTQGFARGYSEHPVMRAYLDTAFRFQIPKDVMAPFFQAMKDDLEVSRFRTFDELLRYVAGSAIPVGQAMTYILGARPPQQIVDLLPGADCLAIAMQLSNFWRDIGEDWKLRRRIYIPQDEMEFFNYTETDLQEQRVNGNLVDLLEYQLERTEQYYRKARPAVLSLARGRWAVMLGLEIYREILPTIRHTKYDVFTRRARPTARRMLALVLKTGLRTL